MQKQAQLFDVTARKFHQVVSVLLLAIAFVAGGSGGAWLVALVGAVFVVGRYWWPADIFRQLVWRVLEPAGLLQRRDVAEDHDTRRIARVLGGTILLVSALLIGVAQSWAWLLVAAIAVMVFLDAAFDVCLLCVLTYWSGRLQARH
jgi:MFS family permease